MSDLGHLKHLQKLDISSTLIKILLGLRNLEALVVFLAQWCHNLGAIPNMCKLTLLQILNLQKSHLIKKVQGLDDLVALQEFRSQNEVLESSPNLHKLIKLVIVEVFGQSSNSL